MDRHFPPTSPILWPSFGPPPNATSATADADDSYAVELRQALLRAKLELESTRYFAQEELRRLESNAGELTHLLNIATRERDEARLQAHSLLLLVNPRRSPAPAPASSSSSEESSRYTCGAAVTEEELEVAAMSRVLPENGRFLEAVMGAGPLLQNLMLAGKLPEWRHPPPAMTSMEIPPVLLNYGNRRSGRGLLSPESSSELKGKATF
ncbi:hypothetical protein KSP39_PZI013259 [Platanthera zijinensis]|uniref:Uncharacterized protein n=1 Tax=Platanthera zijinensis TaxID=2320716 RepID=A0AAP0BD77_9ASPA